MRSLIRACAGSFRLAAGFLLGVLLPLAGAQNKLIKVPTKPPEDAQAREFRDNRYGVRFRVPPGWNLTRKDREVSTFRLDARTATQRAEMRAVATLEFNPFPQSVFSGALFYYSVERHTTDAQCASQAANPLQARDTRGRDVQSRDTQSRDTQSIGGMDFTHGHDEHGGICVEARDEVYTAYRKGSCYRFDLAVNTFCAASSGAQELTVRQMRKIEEQMTAILSSVELDWEKSGPQPVPVPGMPVEPRRELPRSGATPVISGGV